MIDSIALKAIADELNENILRGRVQEIVQLDALTCTFEIYAHQQRRYLFATARPDDARIHLASQKLRASGEPASAFLLLLRKHAEGALIDSITQLPNERVLKIQFDHSQEGTCTLVVEAMGRYANLILLDPDAIVLDAARRVTSAINRARVILPRQIYAPPPPQAKIDPGLLTTEKLATLLDKNPGGTLAQTLVKNVAGVSPLFAREVESRVKGITNYQLHQRIIETLTQLSHAPWQPSIAFENDEPSAFAPYTLTQYANFTPFASISEAIETFYGAEESYAAVKDTIAEKIRGAYEKLARKRDSLASSLPKQAEVEQLKLSGELVLGYASQVRAGQKVLRADTGEGIVEIALDAALSPVENAQKYFKEYHRAKDAFTRVPALLQAAQNDVEYAEQILNDLDLAENRSDIEAVLASAREAGLIVEEKKARVKVPPSEPRQFLSEEGFAILVGKNAKQNEEVTFHRAQSDDLWFHARNAAGAHVVILGNGRPVPAAVIEQAARYAAENSQARSDSRVDVIVTERKNVRKPRRAKPGMVTVRNERVMNVRMGDGGRKTEDE